MFRVMNTVTSLVLLNHIHQGVHVNSASGLWERLYHSATYRHTSVTGVLNDGVAPDSDQHERGWLLAGVLVISGCSSVL